MWMILRPALLTTVTADDFVNPFAQAVGAGFEPRAIWTYTVQNVANAGHFNYVGQLTGSTIVAVWTWAITAAGVHFTTVLAVTKFAILVSAIEVSARLVTRLETCLGHAGSLWRSRMLLIVTFSLLLQVHVPWSNDPVTSYPMAGFGSAALGLLLILFTDRAVAHGMGLRSSVGLAMLALLNVTYYELNVAAVGAATVVVGLTLLSAGPVAGRGTLLLRSSAALLPSLVVAASLTVGSRPSSANYTGTSIELGGETLRQAMSGVVSSLPVSSWHVALAWLDRPVNMGIAVTRFLVIAGGLLLVLIVIVRRLTPLVQSNIRDRSRAIALSLALVSYWLGATAIQAATAKVRDEAPGIGYVYTFYAAGSAVVGILLAACLSALIRSRPGLGRIVVVGTVLLGAYQFALNSTVTMRFNEVMVPAQNLLNVYSEGRDEQQRCQALGWWKSMGWPEYYSSFTEDGMNVSYEHFRGEPFCRLESGE